VRVALDVVDVIAVVVVVLVVLLVVVGWSRKQKGGKCIPNNS